MEAKTITRQYTTVLSQAKKGVPGFALAYGLEDKKRKTTHSPLSNLLKSKD